MDEVTKRRTLQLLGQRAVDYYVDTGQCVFCACDVTLGLPHDESCEIVHELSGVVLTPAWIAEKIRQRAIIDDALSAEGFNMELERHE